MNQNYKATAKKLGKGKSALIEAEQALSRSLACYLEVLAKTHNKDTEERASKTVNQLSILLTLINQVDKE